MAARVELPKLQGATTRFLEPSERPYRIGREDIPLVIEAQQDRSAEFLRGLLARHSAEVKQAIYDFGAILLRGFDVKSERDFEDALVSIRGVRPMKNYFMSEPGRVPAEGADHVFHTNTRFKTGGSFFLGGFHSENYYSTDVPQLQSFWCKQAPKMGGETALVRMSHVYRELPETIRPKLERDAVCSRVFSLAEVAERYETTEAVIERFCEEVGLPVVQKAIGKLICVLKPTVFLHPHTKEPAFLVNFSLELESLDPFLRKRFIPLYAGWKWALHRLGWKHPAVGKLLLFLEHVPSLIRHPSELMRVIEPLVGWWQSRVKRPSRPPSDRPRGPKLLSVADQLDPSAIEGLAEAMTRHCCVASWKSGDVLIFDNCQMLHAGMPGVGARELRVMMCNPIPMPFPLASGLLEVSAGDDYATIDDRLRARLRASSAST